MRCEECGRIIDNAEMWRLGGDPNAPTSRSMLQMCWECRVKGTPGQRRQNEETPATLNETVIADINEAARAFQPGAA